MSLEAKVDLTPISNAVADNVGGANFWPLIIIISLFGVLWLVVWFSLKMFTMLKSVNNAVNNSASDPDDQSTLRSMVKQSNKRLDTLETGVEYIKTELKAHLEADEVQIGSLINQLGEKNK